MDWNFLRIRGILDEIEAERKRQFELYGSNLFNNRVDYMLFVLGEEVGEVNAAMVEYISVEIKANSDFISSDEKMVICKHKMAHVREELVQVAAVAVSIVELIDYNKKHIGETGGESC